jgi:1-phosphatidylinositol phosphodiesterase
MLFTLKASLKVSLISLFLIFSFTEEVSQAHDHHSYSNGRGPVANNPRWMTSLKDDIRLSELSIPGTHDTMSRYGIDYVITQSMTLPIQLGSGIRVLDIRCRHWRDKFPIYHGSFFQNVWFNDVLQMAVNFLKDNPGETILMRVKEEYKPEGNTRTFEETFRLEYWNHYKAHMWQRKDDDDVNPTLGEMRGKIVILQDFDRDKPKYGMPYSTFNIQDYFALDGNRDLYNKWLKVKAHLCAANTDADKPGNKDIKYMNYLSGATKGAGSLGLPFPYFVVSGHIAPATGADRLWTGEWGSGRSYVYPDFPRLKCGRPGRCIYFEGTNTLTYGGIRTGYYTKRVGIIMTDFPGGGLINRIICLNLPKPDKPCSDEPVKPCQDPPSQ